MAHPQRTHRHDTVLLDVDGTLVDSTYHHALAWHRAFQAHGSTHRLTVGQEHWKRAATSLIE